MDPGGKRRRTDDGGGGNAERSHRLATGPCFLKFLMSGNSAGSLIGKQGSELKNLETHASVAIKLSDSGIFFPGTQDRICLIAGEETQIMESLPTVLGKIMNDLWGTVDYEGKLDFSVVAMNNACSAVIGRGGEESKALERDTGAKVKVSDYNKAVPERLVRLSGTYDQVYNGIRIVLPKIQMPDLNKELNYGAGAPYVPMSAAKGGYPDAPYAPFAASRSYPSAGDKGYGGGKDYGGKGGGKGGGGVYEYETSIQMQVPDSSVGAILGRGGEILKNIISTCNCTIKLSEKGEYAPGTDLRYVTLTGRVGALHSAHVRLCEILIDNPGKGGSATPRGFEG